MFAGDDVGRVPSVLARVRGEIFRHSTISPEDVAACVLRHYHRERSELATETHLSLFGLDMQQFLSNGQTIFGEQSFGVMLERLQQVNLEFSLLVHGFDTGNAPHVFTVEHPGSPQFFQTGYWAIGSGAYMALSRLATRQQTSLVSTEEAIYNVCEAKVAAQTALGVGKSTLVYVLDPGATPIRMTRELEIKILGVASRYLSNPVNPAILAEIRADVARQRSTRLAAVQSEVRSGRKSPKRGRKDPPPSQG